MLSVADEDTDLSIAFLQLSARFPFNCALQLSLSLVEQLLAASDSNFDLDSAVL
jgi:hypothetical protein